MRGAISQQLLEKRLRSRPVGTKTLSRTDSERRHICERVLPEAGVCARTFVGSRPSANHKDG